MAIQAPPTIIAASAMIGMVSDRHTAGDQRNGNSRGGKAAQHQRSFRADHRQADLGRNGEGEAAQNQRRGALQCVLDREGRPETAFPEQLEIVDRRLAEKDEKNREDQRREQRAHRPEWQPPPPMREISCCRSNEPGYLS
jgi:hypothetical protein